MSDTTSAPEPPPEPERKSAAHNPLLWATAIVAVIAVALGVWALSERSKADDAKADLAAQKQEAPPATTTTEVHVQTGTQETQPPSETQPESDDGHKGLAVGALAAATAAFANARKQLNESNAKVEDLEAEVDKANAEADKAGKEAEKAQADASSASDAQRKAEAEADQAEAEKRQLGAKAKAAANCTKSMLEIVGEIPGAENIDEGLQKAADDIKAMVPKCKDSVASAGG